MEDAKLNGAGSVINYVTQNTMSGGGTSFGTAVQACNLTSQAAISNFLHFCLRFGF